jgi:ribonuclease P protein component
VRLAVGHSSAAGQQPERRAAAGGSQPGRAGRSASWDRLGAGVDVRRVLRGGRRRSGRLVILYVTPGDSLRAAFVSGRLVGGAVVRNRARRLMREGWRAVAPRVGSGHDVVFAARIGIRGAGMRDVLEEMTRLLAAEGLMSE